MSGAAPPAVRAAATGPSVGAVLAPVLVVEDDDLIRASLGRALAATGYEPLLADSVHAARAILAERVPALVLCDLGLPDGDGLDLVAHCAEVLPRVPVLILTARVEEADLVTGLATGAVDYITKPFRLAELLARLAAHLRFAAASAASDVGRIAVGDLEVDVEARRVRVAGHEVDLRPKEFDLLVRLALDAGKVVRREDLMADVWDQHWWGSTKTLDVHLSALRRHLGERPGGPSRITAVRGVGYRLEA